MIKIIVAISSNNVIGKAGKLPWHYKEDLQYFKKITLGKKVIMGSKTFQSIIDQLGKALPDRQNIVVTKKNVDYPNIEIVSDFISYIKAFPKDDELFVIGGESIYKQALPFADYLYITRINKEYEGDTYFPEFDMAKYQLISETKSNILSFQVWERRK